MNSALVSVIMTAYNSEKYIKESIESVLSQTHQNIQFIIVNDGSTDKTEDIIKSFSDTRIEYYSLSENSHIAHATNVGFSKIRGDFVAIMDSDDLWHPLKLEKQLMFLKENPQHNGCFTWVNLIDENSIDQSTSLPQLKELYSSSTDTREDWLRFFFFYGNRLNNPSSLVAAHTIKEIGNHNEFYIQATDFEWWVRFTKKYSFGIIQEPLTQYRRILQNDASVSSSSESHNTRFYNEYMHIRYHFFDDMDDELFIRTFQSCFRNPNAGTPEELECEKAFLLCNPLNYSACIPALSLVKLEKLLGNSKTAAILKEKYNFTTITCGAYTGQHLYNDPVLQKYPDHIDGLKNMLNVSQLHIGKLDTEIQGLHNTIQELNMQISGLKTELNTTLQELEHMTQELHMKDTQLKLITNSLSTITNSTSWKITAPIRKLWDLLHK